MNTVNDTFDTTSKVNLLERQSLSPSPTQRRNRSLIKIFFCFVILLALITGGILLSLIHQRTVNSQIQFNLKQANQEIENFCSVTLHLAECITSLSSSSIATNGRKKIGPDDIFSVSLVLASNEWNNVDSLTKSLILISTETRSVSALQQCAGLIDDSLDKLNRSLTTSVCYTLLADEKIRDMTLWINGSVSDLKGCSTLLVKDESKAVDGLRASLQMAMIYASNSLEFLKNRDGIISLIESWNSQYSEPVVDNEYLSLLCFFCPQYLILLLLYFLLLRKY